MAWYLHLTKKATELIERVAAGQELGNDELNLATTLWLVTTSSPEARRFLRDYQRGNPLARRLEARGYIERVEDTSEELLEEAFKEEKSYLPEDILPNELAISEKGKSLLDSVAGGAKLTRTEAAVGRTLWHFVRDEIEVSPWTIKKLLDEGYLIARHSSFVEGLAMEALGEEE